MYPSSHGFDWRISNNDPTNSRCGDHAMKLTTLAICTIILALGGCIDVNDITQEMKFTQHQTTGLCFAVHLDVGAFTNVPCNSEVLAIINGQPTAAPVRETENIR
jgi:hypothetical protein